MDQKPSKTGSAKMLQKQKSTSEADEKISDADMKTFVREEIRIMADKIMREEIEKEIEEKISSKKISAARRTRIYKKVIDDVRKNVPELLEKIFEDQLKNTGEDAAEHRVSEDVHKEITEQIRNFVHRSMEKAIADEIFEKVKIEKLSRTPMAEPKLGLIGVRHAQVLMVFLFLAVSYIQRVDISVAIVAMSHSEQANPNFREFEWNDRIIGLLFSSFYWGYSIVQIPGGILAENYGPKMLMSSSMILCSTAAFFMPAATVLGGWIGLYIMKTLQGVTQATFVPAVYVFTARWIPPKEKSRLFTPAFGGMQLGTVIGMPVSGLLCASFAGWPSVFFFSAFIGYIWSVTWLFLGANSPSVHRSISREEQVYIEGSFGFGEVTLKGAKKKIPWKLILSSIPFWALMVAHFGQNWAYFTLFTYMPVYINSVLGIDITWNSFLSASSFLVGWILIVIFGFISSYIHDKKLCGLETERKLWNSLAFYGGGITFIILGLSQTRRTDVAMLLLTVIIATNSGVYNGFYSNHADLSPNYVGILMGLTNTMGNLAALLAPLFVGHVITEPVNTSQWAVVFLTSAGILIITNTIFILFGSSQIQPWNTPSDLYLQLEDDVSSFAYGSSRQRNPEFIASSVDLADHMPSVPKDVRYRNSI